VAEGINLEEGDEVDPRAELVRRLQEYERFKKVAEALGELPRQGRDTFSAQAAAPPLHIERAEPDVELKELLFAFKDVLNAMRSGEVTRARADYLLERICEVFENDDALCAGFCNVDCT